MLKQAIGGDAALRIGSEALEMFLRRRGRQAQDKPQDLGKFMPSYVGSKAVERANKVYNAIMGRAFHPLWANKRISAMDLPAEPNLLKGNFLARLKQHAGNLKDPRNVAAAASELTPFSALLAAKALHGFAEDPDPKEIGGYLGSILGGNLAQGAGIRAGVGGAVLGNILGSQMGKGVSKLIGRKEKLEKTSELTLEEKLAFRMTINHSGTTAYNPAEESSPSMDQSDKIPHTEGGAEDSSGADDIGEEGRQRGLRSIISFNPDDVGALAANPRQNLIKDLSKLTFSEFNELVGQDLLPEDIDALKAQLLGKNDSQKETYREPLKF